MLNVITDKQKFLLNQKWDAERHLKYLKNSVSYDRKSETARKDSIKYWQNVLDEAMNSLRNE